MTIYKIIDVRGNVVFSSYSLDTAISWKYAQNSPGSYVLVF